LEEALDLSSDRILNELIHEIQCHLYFISYISLPNYEMFSRKWMKKLRVYKGLYCTDED